MAQAVDMAYELVCEIDDVLASCLADHRDPARITQLCSPSVPALSGEDQGQGGATFTVYSPGLLSGRSFRKLEDLNAQFDHWRTTIANPRVHATTNLDQMFARDRVTHLAICRLSRIALNLSAEPHA